MNRSDVVWLYNHDPESFEIQLSRLDVSEFDEPELFAIESFPRVLRAIYSELELLKKEMPSDKDVQYITSAVDSEGAWYCLIHKLDVEDYLGPRSTCAKLATVLRGAGSHP